jgi:acetyl-CoA acyltransferase
MLPVSSFSEEHPVGTPEPRALRDVVFVDGVRTPFGRAGEKGMYAETRADDMVVAVIRELLRRHP